MALRKMIEGLVSKIISRKADDPNADVSMLEEELNHRVYELYGLSKQQINVVEEFRRTH